MERTLLNLEDDTVNAAMVEGIREMVKREIKAYIMEDVLSKVDELLEDVTKTITKNMMVYLNERAPAHTFDRNIKLEVLLNTPSGRLIEAIGHNEIRVEEKREHQR